MAGFDTLFQQFLNQKTGTQQTSQGLSQLNALIGKQALGNQQRKADLEDKIELFKTKNKIEQDNKNAAQKRQIDMAIAQGLIPPRNAGRGQQTQGAGIGGVGGIGAQPIPPSIQPSPQDIQAQQSLVRPPTQEPLRPQFDNLNQEPQAQKQFPFRMFGGNLIKNPEFVSQFAREKQDLASRKSAQDVDLTNINSSQEIEARSLSRRIGGVRGARDIFPAVIRSMQEGKTIDEIEDAIRFGGQSKALTGPVRDAAQSILINSPVAKTQQTLDFIDDELSRGNITKVNDILKKSARDTAGVEERRSVMGKERTVEFLNELQSDLDTLQQNGVNTNIFTGTLEDINSRIGRVNKPELRKVATRISVAIQTYRRSMSGVAFSVPESNEYKAMFPSIGRTANFNEANISALTETMQGDLDKFYSLSMGPENYNTLFGGQQAPARQGFGQFGGSNLSGEEDFSKMSKKELEAIIGGK